MGLCTRNAQWGAVQVVHARHLWLRNNTIGRPSTFSTEVLSMTPPPISPTGGWIGTIIFVLITIAALVLFGTRTGKLVTLLVKARPENRTDRINARIGEFFLTVLGR